jgi:hypothetical protein
MATYCLAEHRHRYNHRVSVQRRPCFPDLDDTWLIDNLQDLLSANRDVILFSEWVNTTDCAQTAESFGTVPLHSAALGEAIASIEREPFKLTREQEFIPKVMGFPLPPLPVHGEKECALTALFLRLVLQHTSHRPDFEQMAIAWCAHVKPSEGIFPKLPVNLRLHHAAYERSVRVRDAVIAAADARAELEQLKRATLPAARILPAARSAPPPPVALLAQPAPAAACGAAAATEAAGALARAAPRLPLAPPLAQPIQAFARPTTNYSLAAAPRPLAMIGGPQWSDSHSYGTVTLLSHGGATHETPLPPESGKTNRTSTSPSEVCLGSLPISITRKQYGGSS